jgi:hypothetical protein
MRLELFALIERIGAAEAARRLHWPLSEMLDMVVGRVAVPAVLAGRLARFAGDASSGWHPDLARLMELEGWRTIPEAARGLGISPGYLRQHQAAPSGNVKLHIDDMLRRHEPPRVLTPEEQAGRDRAAAKMAAWREAREERAAGVAP